MPELRIAIGMILALFGLAVGLQTVALMVKNLGHLGMTDRMLAPRQGLGDGACALASPAQGRFGIASRLLIDDRLQPVQQLGIGLANRLAAASGTTDAPFKRDPSFNLPNSLTDCLS